MIGTYVVYSLTWGLQQSTSRSQPNMTEGNLEYISQSDIIYRNQVWIITWHDREEFKVGSQYDMIYENLIGLK